MVKGSKVKLLDTGEICTVVEELSIQFIVEDSRGRWRFFFKSDKGTTWEEVIDGR